jgi:hypothetical protein
MFKAIKRNLVQSYVGAVGLGSLLAQCVTHFVNIFVMPIASFVSHREWDSVVQHSGHDGFSLAPALPELIRFSVLLLVFYVLLRWLYYAPVERQAEMPA